MLRRFSGERRNVRCRVSNVIQDTIVVFEVQASLRVPIVNVITCMSEQKPFPRELLGLDIDTGVCIISPCEIPDSLCKNVREDRIDSLLWRIRRRRNK